jgi:biofilm protein TabA
MILDKVENAAFYASVLPYNGRAFSILKDSMLIHQPDGKYVIEEGRFWYMVQRYETRPAELCKFESHDQFADIHFMVSGEELIGHTFREGLQVSSPYDAEGDKTYYEHKPLAQLNAIRLSPGCFAIFFPQDVHMPCLQNEQAGPVHKVVFKLPSKC